MGKRGDQFAGVRVVMATIGATAMLASSPMACSDSSASSPQKEEVARSAQAVGAEPEPGCVAGSFGGHDYWFCPSPKTFDQARGNCTAAGMDLASIGSAQENEHVRGSVQADSLIGFTDRQREGAWKWIADGKLAWCSSGIGPTSFVNWAAHEPSTPQCDYVAHGSRGYWFCGDHATWDAAASSCGSIGLELARVADADEDAFVQSHIEKSSWLGATNAGHPADWAWKDGGALFWSAGAPVVGMYNHWAPGQSNDNGASRCLLMHKGGAASWYAHPCDAQAAWVCAGPAVVDPEPPDARDCTSLRILDGSWVSTECTLPEGYVCETAPVVDPQEGLNQRAKYIRDDYRTGKPRVSHVQFRDDASVTDPFSLHGDRLGMRDCLDSLVVTGAPRPQPRLSAEAVDYRQAYRGVPLHTRGYTVLRDPLTKVARSFTGRFEHNINLEVNPAIQEHAAFAVAVTAFGTKAKDYGTDPPAGELVIFPAIQGPTPDWRLAWLFSFPAAASFPAATVAVSAKTGAVLYKAQAIASACPTVDQALMSSRLALSMAHATGGRGGCEPPARGWRADRGVKRLVRRC